MPARSERISGVNPQYMLVRSRRRTLSLIVHEDGSLEVRCPLRYPREAIERFIRDKAAWIERKRQASQNSVRVGAIPDSQRQQAEAVIRHRFGELEKETGFCQPVKVRIRDQRSRWGSCSSRGSISLNRRCALLPISLQDYVYLHELCHLRYMNHSAEFWQLLRQVMPDAGERRRELNRYRLVNQNDPSDVEGNF